jgi:hypothetical protein
MRSFNIWGSIIGIILGLIVGNLIGAFVASEVVEVNLVNANADLAGGKVAWQFEVDDRSVSAGKSVRVFNENFNIQVIEFESKKKVDELNVGSLIEKGDLVTYAYYGSASPQGESLYIYIKHKDGDTREVKVNIDNNQ